MADIDILGTIRLAYHELGRRVNHAIHVHVGDPQRLHEQYTAADGLLQSVHQHRLIMAADEYSTIANSLLAMMTALDEATTRSREHPLTMPTPTTIVYGEQGRPRIEIDPGLLGASLDLRGPSGLASVFGCSARTIRRRAIEYGLVEPGPPVYVTYEDEETGELLRWYSSSTAPTSQLTDDEVDLLVTHILNIFPSFGCRMLTGAAANLTHRPIERRVYQVATPNSLWHHDGQHGMIRWRIVIHAFIDGYSRLVTGIQANDNNRARTVLDLFESAISVHGTPSRVRGDHGVENVEVAAYMEWAYGRDRGSYIWGRSVHNIRIERLWVDITRRFGLKWYNFFMDLELHARLDPNNDSHIWLLHHLFLPSLNQDATEWAEAWNSHSIQRSGARDRSPRDLFFFGVLENGIATPDGLPPHIEGWPLPASQHPREDIEDLLTYGVDWEDLDDHQLLQHHILHNPPANEPLDVETNQPENMSLVEVPSFECPLMDDDLEAFDEFIHSIPQLSSRSMTSCRIVWVEALREMTALL
ncbi:hypothetical protein ONZ45_g1958 [Pleurotus djamor]|nr:hypothetical protein ONZ45_g1958 [Pleurotus djamor]